MTKIDQKKAKILKNNFLKVKKTNKGFSLRSLSLKLDTSHVFLSKVFNGKAKPSGELLEKLIKFLKIDQLESAILKNENLEHKTLIKTDTADYSASPEIHLGVMRKWWNFAILDLLTCELGVKFTAETIALFLPVAKNEIEISLKQLTDIGLIENTKDGYKKKDQKIRMPTRGPNESTRAFYRQTLQLASEQLDKTTQDDFDKRLILGFSCAANKKNVAVVKQKLASALRECAELLSDGDCEDVYVVQGQMFSVLKS